MIPTQPSLKKQLIQRYAKWIADNFKTPSSSVYNSPNREREIDSGF